jgi:hypothetical protein
MAVRTPFAMARFVKLSGYRIYGPQGPRSSAMRFKGSIYLTSFLTSIALATAPMAAQAGGMSRIGTYSGNKGMKPGGPNCKPGYSGGNRQVNIYKPTNIQNNINVYKPVTVNKNVNIYKPVTIDKSINVYKPITINKNVEINKSIDITKNIDNSKYIDNSKNINIQKSIVINKGGGEAEALAIAVAFAQASASASASAHVNINNMSGGVSYVSSGSYVEAPPSYAGGDLGNISVQAPQQCVWREATVVKAVRALCVSADGREFPAAHMTGDTWINGGYEGELARCLPGSVLKVMLGKVSQSNQGMAGAFEGAELIQCRPREALRHYKGGMLKCAPAVAVPDCTERANLRKWGTGDMFVSYFSQVCVDVDSREYSQTLSRDPQSGRY